MKILVTVEASASSQEYHHHACWAQLSYLAEHDRWKEKVCARREHTKNLPKIADGVTGFDPWEEEWTCIEEDRVGAHYWGDGPKWMCGVRYLADRPDCLVYSIGSNEQDDFERAIKRIAPQCEVHTFDPTVHADVMDERSKQGGYTFHLTGLGSQEQSGNVMKNGKLYTFEETLAQLGHNNRTIDVLKMDCENCEWKVLGEEIFGMIADKKLVVNQMQVEMHNYIAGAQQKKLIDFFENADRADMRVFHKEGITGGARGHFVWNTHSYREHGQKKYT